MRSSIAALVRILATSPVRFLVLAFVLANVAGLQEGGVNPASRFAALRAMSEGHTFRIDHYTDRTCDWAQTPDGAYYSNKAPGPAFLAFPLVVAFDAAAARLWPDDIETYQGTMRRAAPGIWYRTLVSVLLQALPYALVVILCVHLLAASGVGPMGQYFAAAAALFGNTAAVLMNTFFGHGLAAMLLLAFVLALVHRRFFWAGSFLGWALLSDYGIAALLPGVAVGAALACRGEPARAGWRGRGLSILGGALPGALWIWYHTVCFGSPWALPFKYQNPSFVSAASSGTGLWGTVGFLPSLNIVAALLAGKQRGLLLTQPWLLVVFVALVVLLAVRMRRSPPSTEGTVALAAWLPIIAPIAVLGLLGILWMNAGFNGWHGGGAPGPRYMSIVFPLFAILGGIVHDASGRGVRILLWITLAFAVALRALMFAGDIRAVYTRSIWGVYLRNLGNAFPSTAWLYLLLFVLLLAWAVLRSWPLSRESTPGQP